MASATQVDELIRKNFVMMFSASDCPSCGKVKDLFTKLGVNFFALELDRASDENEIKTVLIRKTNQLGLHNVFVQEANVGGCDEALQAYESGKLLSMIKRKFPPEPKFNYDLIVIGGGSGGIAASKEASRFGKRVAVCDFVKPSPYGTNWGLGGTCVNVGCIPKKLMHKAAIIGKDMKDASSFGWEIPEVQHDWNKMTERIQGYIKSLNWGYKSYLREKNIKYYNSFAVFEDKNTLSLTRKNGNRDTITAEYFIVAVGGRPRYPPIPGIEHCISSDDLFSLSYCPGKTLLVGASYIALECAGFLQGMGCDCSVMVRSILLRGFDQQMADMIGNHMEAHGVKFIRNCVPVKVEKIQDGEPGLLRVTGENEDGEEVTGEYNTVVVAIGRSACTGGMGLSKIGVKVNPKNSKIVCDSHERTSVDNIFAIGDVCDGKPELTPVAIKTGRLLARRLFFNSKVLMDYTDIPTTVFTPLEYGCVGLSEEAAVDKFGNDDIEVYHQYFMPLEYELPNRDKNKCYAKLLCVKSQNERVVGFHILGPNAGEITQGFALGIKLGVTKSDFDNTMGIHPTCAEIFTSMETTKASGAQATLDSC